MHRLRRDFNLAALAGRDITHVLCYVLKDRCYHGCLWMKRRLS